MKHTSRVESPNAGALAIGDLIYALRKRDPAIVARATLSDIETMFKSVKTEQIDERLCAGLDMYYKAFTRRALAHPEEDQTLEAFDRHMAKQLNNQLQTRISSLRGAYDIRWELLKELIADQRSVYKQASGNDIVRRKHVMEILGTLNRAGEEGKYQNDLLEELGIAKSTLSTLISRLEEARLVKKSGAGRENLLIITHAGAVVFRKEADAIKRRNLAARASIQRMQPKRERMARQQSQTKATSTGSAAGKTVSSEESTLAHYAGA